MQTILLANVGNRNLKYDWDVTFFDKEGKNFWNMTQMIYEDIEHEKHHVELNILNSVLEHYKEIDTIFLFVTNQSHHQDTYYAGKIIEHVLQHKYTVRLIEKTDDPRIREKAFQFFECFYKEEKILYNHQVIICGSGGIPAMKEGLIFYGSFLPDSVICDVDEHTHQVFESKVAQEYLKNMKKNTLKEMIRKYEFSGANHFIQNFKGKKKTEIEKYLSYLNYRYNFDFEEANKLIEDCKSKYVREIDINDSKMLLEELVSNIDISYQKGEYLSCLGKIFALTELLIKQLFQERYALNPEKDFEAIQKLPGIDGKDIQWNPREIKIQIKENREWKQYVETNDLREYLEWDGDKSEIFQGIKSLNPLKAARNKSIMAHNLGWIKKNEKKHLQTSIKKIRKALEHSDNIYEILQKELLEKIQKL